MKCHSSTGRVSDGVDKYWKSTNRYSRTASCRSGGRHEFAFVDMDRGRGQAGIFHLRAQERLFSIINCIPIGDLSTSPPKDTRYRPSVVVVVVIVG